MKVRIRKSTKYVCLIVAIVLMSISISNLLVIIQRENVKTATKDIYNYQNKFNYNYDVSYIENDYVNDLNKTNVFVTDLIKDINLNLNYELSASQISNLKGTYSVIGVTEVTCDMDGGIYKIWEDTEVLIPEKAIDENTDKIDLSENLVLNLNEKNSLIENFEKDTTLSVDACYKIMYKIKLNTQIEGKDIEIVYEPNVSMNLAKKICTIEGENNLEDTQYISKEYDVRVSNSIAQIAGNIVLLICAIALWRYAVKHKVANIVTNEFRQGLNRILRLCADKIVQLSTMPDDSNANVVEVKDFGEIVKLSEELFKPILYYLDSKSETAYFSVVTGNTTYRYIFKK